MTTIDGVLHVILTPKRRYGLNIVERLIVGALEESGHITVDYHPPTYFILTERRTDRGYWYQYRFKGRPRALAPTLAGHQITVRANTEPFHNGLGAYLDRPRVVSVGAFVECPYHDDPYDAPTQGSARVFCRQQGGAG